MPHKSPYVEGGLQSARPSGVLRSSAHCPDASEPMIEGRLGAGFQALAGHGHAAGGAKFGTSESTSVPVRKHGAGTVWAVLSLFSQTTMTRLWRESCKRVVGQ